MVQYSALGQQGVASADKDNTTKKGQKTMDNFYEESNKILRLGWSLYMGMMAFMSITATVVTAAIMA